LRLEEEADEFARQLRSDQMGDCDDAIGDSSASLEALEKLLEEMFGLLGDFQGKLDADKAEGGDEEKEIKIEEMLARAKNW